MVASSQVVARFSQLTSSDGLAYNAVTAITQDDHGFIWLGTRNGLSRYDGYEFKNFVYQAQNDKQGLSGVVVRSLLFDQKGFLWIGLDKKGLNRYDPRLNQFISGFDTAHTVVAMADNGDGKIWLATEKGLQLFDTSTHTTETVIGNVYVRALALVNDKLYVGTQTGLLVYDVLSGEHAAVIFPHGEMPAARSILLQSDGLLLATTNGLYDYQFQSRRIERINLTLKPPYRFLSLTQDQFGAIWLGSTQHGIYRLIKDNVSNQYQVTHQFSRDAGFSQSLGGNTVISLYVDRENNLWAGSFNGGASRLNLSSLAFGMFNHSSASIGCLPSEVIYAMHKQSDGTLWLGTQQGLAIIDGKTAQCQVFEAKRELDSLPHQNLKVIYPIDDKRFWIGTSRGLALFDLPSLKFNRVSGPLSRANITFVLQDDAGGYVVGTTSGLYYRASNSSSFKLVSTSQARFNYRRFHTEVKTPDGQVWLATDQGLAYLELGSEPQVKTWLDQKGKPITSALRVLNHNQGQLWLGERATDFRSIDLATKKMTLQTPYLDVAEQPMLITLESLLFDQQGRIWLSTSRGILVKERDSWRLFSRNDGLQGDNFLTRSRFQAADGELFFGGRQGFNRFYPQQVVDLPQLSKPPNAQITGFSLFNQPLSIGQSIKDSDFLLTSSAEFIDDIALSHRDYVFGFEFSGLSFADPKRNRYQYQLQGFDAQWIEVGANQRRASYSNLAAGEYQFVLRASNKDGIWQQQARKVKVNVAAAPWATPWAYASYIVLLITAIIGFLAYRTRSLRHRAQLLQQKVSERTLALEQQKQKVEQLLEQKNDEFANVSHEFRTPLTLVLGPVGQMLSEQLSIAHKNKLQTVKRNGYRLLRMVDQLLHMEKFRVQSIGQPRDIELAPMISLIAQSFADLAHEQQIEFEIDEIVPVYVSFTNDGMEKVLLNLLSNAIKYTQAGGKIVVGSEYIESQQKVKIRIKDTGIGIAPAQLAQIFNRFHRVLDSRSERVTGAGIGLALVKQLVEANGGEIAVHSEVGVGSEFTVYLPCSRQSDSSVSVSNQEMIELELESIQGQQFVEVEANAAIAEDFSDDTRPTVLIVEDNPDMRQYIYQSLVDNYQLHLAANGQAGFEQTKMIVPDIIVSDVMMPIMDGYQLTQAIKQEQTTSHIPVVLLTARDDKQSRLKGWHQKADEYLTKPFDPQELMIRIDNLLAIRDILRQRFNQMVFSQTETPSVPALEVDLSEKEQEIAQEEQSKVAAQQAFLAKVDDILTQVYSEQSTTVPQIAKLVAMSERQLFRKLKATVDMNPTEYLRRFRLQKACELLSEGMVSSRVALEVGFSSHSYFSRCFSALYGVAPSKYKR